MIRFCEYVKLDYPYRSVEEIMVAEKLLTFLVFYSLYVVIVSTKLAQPISPHSDLNGPTDLHRNVVVKHSTSDSCHGVVILGMHRSGTSLLAGLIEQLGLNTGGSLLPAVAHENSKGYFENVDVYKQNVRLLGGQNASHNYNTYNFSNTLASIDSRHGKSAVSFFNNVSSTPWMLKEPRLCITLPVWLRYFDTKPAVLFTYRDPVEVLYSFQSRKNQTWVTPNRIFRLWYVYNRRAIESSHGLCRVVTSYQRIMKEPVQELNSIYKSLQERCQLPKLKSPNTTEVLSFVDHHLKHHTVSRDFNDCKAPAQTSDDLAKHLLEFKIENLDLKLYQEVMKLYCAIEEKTTFNNEKNTTTKSKFDFDYSIKDELLS